MKNRKVGSMIRIFFCAGLVLGVGYLGVVKGGKMVLGNEEKPQKANFEDTSSNVFFGKIEEDIQLFPWNYYGKNEVHEALEETYLAETLALMQEKVYSMEAVHCGVSRETIDAAYEKKGSNIVENVRAFDTDYGEIFFYQDTLEVRGEEYQVKAAFSDYAIYNFTCMKNVGADVRQTEEWKKGKEKLKKMLDNYQYEIGIVTFNVEELEYLNNDELYVIENSKNANKNVESSFAESYAMQMENLQQMLNPNENGEVGVENNIGVVNEAWAVDSDDSGSMYDDIENYSYQIIELNDVILLLVQGDYMCQGIYYDPIEQTVCGYNMFMQ